MARKHRAKVVPRSRAREFAREARDVLEAARRAHENGDVRLAAIGAVNACVRASDALSVAALGEHAQGDDHADAIALLERVPEGKRLAASLRLALQYKSQWSYGVNSIRSAELTKVIRAAENLVSAAESRA